MMPGLRCRHLSMLEEPIRSTHSSFYGLTLLPGVQNLQGLIVFHDMCLCITALHSHFIEFTHDDNVCRSCNAVSCQQKKVDILSCESDRSVSKDRYIDFEAIRFVLKAF